ncbi:MAG TPA: SHOCT domain-containing protein [bacterium]|jgi:hypothetical protein|nr:SHOCT domain-containing protein [bacterium]
MCDCGYNFEVGHVISPGEDEVGGAGVAGKPKDLISFEQTRLQGGERTIRFLSGSVGEFMGKGANSLVNGVVILTNQRVVFYSRPGLFSQPRIESSRLDKINSVDSGRTGIISFFFYIKFVTSGNSLTVSVPALTKQTQEFIDAVILAVEDAKGKSSISETSSTAPSLAGELSKLAALAAQGVLTKEEFERAKAKLLSK